jgi:hypothetical protein
MPPKPIMPREFADDTAVRAVVLTVTVTVEAVVSLTVAEAGTVHVAPCGAPVQVRVAVPAMPVPPIVKL